MGMGMGSTISAGVAAGVKTSAAYAAQLLSPNGAGGQGRDGMSAKRNTAGGLKEPLLGGGAGDIEMTDMTDTMGKTQGMSKTQVR